MLGYSAPSTILISNDTFSESCRRDLSNGALFGAGTLVDVEQSSFDNRSRGVLSCVIYGTLVYKRQRHTSCLRIISSQGGLLHTTH